MVFRPTTPEQKLRMEEHKTAFNSDGPFAMAPLTQDSFGHFQEWTIQKEPPLVTLMHLLPGNYQGLENSVLGRMRPVPSFAVLCKAAIDLAECFRKLHNQGLCYKDINLGGPLIDPETGDIMICDTDNVRYNKTQNIIFIFFAAPELIRNETICQTNTDLHSLAVLLFYMFMRHHPLDGARELQD